MKISCLQAIQFCLIPVLVESFVFNPELRGDRSLQDLFLGIISSRNAMYVTSAITLLGGVGAVISTPNTWTRTVFVRSAQLGGIGLGVAVSVFYSRVSELRNRMHV
jgi:hypothetical protein